jgi:hypothetical protein
MDALDFITLHGRPVAREVAKQAGTSLVYLLHIAYGHRHPSRKLAQRLVAACADMDPALRLDLNSLLFDKE